MALSSGFNKSFPECNKEPNADERVSHDKLYVAKTIPIILKILVTDGQNYKK